MTSEALQSQRPLSLGHWYIPPLLKSLLFGGVYVCVFSSGAFALNAGHQTQLFPGESSILYRKYPHLPAVCITC